MDQLRHRAAWGVVCILSVEALASSVPEHVAREVWELLALLRQLFGDSLNFVVFASAMIMLALLAASTKFVARRSRVGECRADLVEPFALFLVGKRTAECFSSSTYATFGAGVAVFVLWFLVLGRKGWTQGLGIARPVSFGAEVGAGVLGMAGVLVIQSLTLLSITPLGMHMATGASVTMGQVFFVSVGEEVVYRGALFSSLRTRLSMPAAATLSAGVFAAQHDRPLHLLPVFLVAGYVYATLREWRGSLIAVVIAHCGFNTVIFSLIAYANGS